MPRVLRLLVPLAIAIVAAVVAVGDRARAADASGYSPGVTRAGRVVLIIVDSLTDRLAEDPAAFPALAALRPRALWGRMAGCLPASTVPCTRTLLEGSAAGYVAGLANFSASRASDVSWPVLAARAGLRLAVASDHTLVNMCEGLGGPRLYYPRENVPVFGWDEAAAARVAEWMRDDAADAFLIHLVDLDKASHAAGPGTELYRREVRGADRALAAIAALLAPSDSLIVVGDHGHDAFGSHTPDPGYLAVGPAFVPGRLDLEQASTALLLSAAAGTPLPRSYEGDVPEQGLRVPFGGDLEARRRVAAEVGAAREGRRALTRAGVSRFLPGLGLALLSLVAFAFERGKRVHAAAVALGAAAAAWLTGSVWSIYGRPLLWQGPARNVLHHVGLLVAFVVGTTVLLGRLSRLDRAARVGLALLAFPFVVPLVGDDYFGSPTSLARFFVPALVLLLHAELLAGSRWALATLAASVGAVALTLGPVPSGDGWLPVLGAAALGAVALAACAEPARRTRALVGALVVLAFLGAGMRFGARATLALALLAVTTACFARSGARHGPAALALVGAAAVFLGYWGSLRSLRFEQVRFEFVFAFIPPSAPEATVAVLGGLLTLVKYGLVPGVIVSATPRLDAAGHGVQCAGWLLLSALLHSAWVAGAALDPVSRYHETGIQAACLLGALALLSVAAVAIAGWVRSGAPVVAASPPPGGGGG